jgi:flavin-dependent dehydrogenase
LGRSYLGPLRDGGRVVVIGGGPGGASAALALKRGARSQGQSIQVTIVEGKKFFGEQHHNQCVGVLSPPIIQLIEQDLGVPFPSWLIQGEIAGYVLHSRRRQLRLEGEAHPSVVLRRVQFDAYLLEAACERGAELVSARATGIEFHDTKVVVYTENKPLEADVIIGAFGLDEGTAVLFHRNVGYKPPPALGAIVTKVHHSCQTLSEPCSWIHAFLPPSSKIEFSAITPKENHLTLNIAGKKVDSEMMRLFLNNPAVQNVMSDLDAGCFDCLNDLNFYRGAFPCGLAKNFAGDRFVMVGDAAGLVRAFKGKGVTSAVQTGIRAADTILNTGISRLAFESYHQANRDITSDMLYGKVTRWLTIAASRMGMMDIILDAAERNVQLRTALFEAVSAHQSYRAVLSKTLSFDSIRAVTQAAARAALEH